MLRWDLAPALRRPISTRLFGQNKTWRGAVVMTAGTVAAAVALHRIPSYRQRLPVPVADTNPFLIGALLGIASWTGELPNSFFKRRLGIPSGEHRRSAIGAVISLVDQADWVPTAWVLLRPVWRMSAREAVQVFVLVAALHVALNVIGYAIGARATPR